MKVSLEFLNDYVDIDMPVHEFCNAMTMSGTKVEGYETLTNVSGVVFGRILTKEKHENADSLWVCNISTGAEEHQIITAAQNIEVGHLIPVALHGAVLAGGKTIKRGKLRGVLSDGMMCSHDELGLEITDIPGACDDGILIFKEQYPLGADVAEVLNLNQTIIEFELTSNRPDCVSVIGLAREAAATLSKPLICKKYPINSCEYKTADYIKVICKNPELCKRYMARLVKGVRIAPSPKWLKDRLRACGIRPINNIVDITNFVMLEYGQPLHAFDYDKLSAKEIVIRRSENEKVTTLDGIERQLGDDTLLICDGATPVAIAGVMGGENSEIEDDTVNVLLESANFSKTSVRKTSKALGLRSESSSRFEKGLYPELCSEALERACQLMEHLASGSVAADAVDVYPEKQQSICVDFEPDKINRLLGTNLDENQMKLVLERAFFEVRDSQVYVPHFRSDVTCMNDLAEEIARLYGYNNLPSVLEGGSSVAPIISEAQRISDAIKGIATAYGFYEAMTFPFTGAKSFESTFCDISEAIAIKNPIGAETSLMRTNLSGSILESLRRNSSARNKRVRLFEIANVYHAHELPLTRLPNERQIFAAGAFGDIDFFDIKGLCCELLEYVGIDAEFVSQSDNKLFHPGKCADIVADGMVLGTLGEIHPEVNQAYELTSPAYYMQMYLDVVGKIANFEKIYNEIPRYPGVERDIAVLVNKDVTVGQLQKVIRSAGGNLLKELTLFDIYMGKNLPENKKSVAFSLTFRSADKTLTDAQIQRPMDRILKELESQLGGVLRK